MTREVHREREHPRADRDPVEEPVEVAELLALRAPDLDRRVDDAHEVAEEDRDQRHAPEGPRARRQHEGAKRMTKVAMRTSSITAAPTLYGRTTYPSAAASKGAHAARAGHRSSGARPRWSASATRASESTTAHASSTCVRQMSWAHTGSCCASVPVAVQAIRSPRAGGLRDQAPAQHQARVRGRAGSHPQGGRARSRSAAE